MKKHIPNTLTLLNLLFGFLAIVNLFSGQVTTAVWFILCAAVFDFLDGFAARMLHAYSELGKQLDSLADMVSFGVAPALVLFHEVMLATGNHFPAPFPSNVFLFFPALLVIGAGLRLGRFNVKESGKQTFEGLPTPAMALFIISLPLVRTGGYFNGFFSFLTHPAGLAIIALLFSWLMISRLPMFSLKFKSYRVKDNQLSYSFLLLSLILLLIFSVSGLFFVIILYIFIALGASFVTRTTS